MGAYTELTAAGVTTRDAAGLTGVSRATATRRRARTAPGPVSYTHLTLPTTPYV